MLHNPTTSSAPATRRQTNVQLVFGTASKQADAARKEEENKGEKTQRTIWSNKTNSLGSGRVSQDVQKGKVLLKSKS